MEKQRCVERLHSVFDLKIHKVLNLPEEISTRVMLTYDKKLNKKEFKVLGKQTTNDLNRKIAQWLEENIDIQELICNLGIKEINADLIGKSLH